MLLLCIVSTQDALKYPVLDLMQTAGPRTRPVAFQHQLHITVVITALVLCCYHNTVPHVVNL